MLVALGLWGCLVGSAGDVLGEGPIDVRPGAAFPDLRFDALLVAADYPALGLPGTGGPFSLSDVPGDILVLEFFNKSCVPCQTQVRSLQAFFQYLEEEGFTEQVRVLGVGAGNKLKYLPKFRAKRGLRFPIASDPTLDRWRTIGGPGNTPFTVVLLRRDGHWVLGDAHVGVKDAEWFRVVTLGHLHGKPPAEMETPTPEQARGPRSLGLEWK